jgi:ribosomal protein S2
MQLLTRAARFIKIAIKKKNLKFIFVGNPPGSEEKTASVFTKIKKNFFPNEKWSSGFLSKKPICSNYILVIYNITQNQAAFYEALHVNIPVVAFVTPFCNICGVDYPIVLNLKHNKIWYANFFKALFINDTKFKSSKI